MPKKMTIKMKYSAEGVNRNMLLFLLKEMTSMIFIL